MFQAVDLSGSQFSIETFFNDFGALNDHSNETKSLVILPNISTPITRPFVLEDMSSLKVHFDVRTDATCSSNI